MLQIENRAQLERMCMTVNIVLDESWDIGEYPIHGIQMDEPITFDAMAEIVDYLREQNKTEGKVT